MTTTDTLRTDACPHCGSERIPMPRFDDGRIQYYCGSGESWRSAGCRSTARIKGLEAEVERLRANLRRAIEIAEEFWDNQKQAVLVYHQELADELGQLKETFNQEKK